MYEQIDFPGRSAVKVKLQETSHFTYPWHFHDEYEILYIIEGKGTRFVADSISPFEVGELVLLGNNLPHFWRSDESYHNEENPKLTKYLVIQFPGNFLRDEINNYPEYHLIGKLFKKAARGIKFHSVFTEKICGTLMKLTQKSGIEKILLLQEILHEMSKTTELELLAGEFYKADNHSDVSDRMTKVTMFLTTNYRGKIELDKVAEIANLHPSSFCRYFKEKTGKSLSEYVNDMRISYACRLLIDGKLSISQIGFESGFNNLSNFNRAFKKHTGFTPSGYFREFSQ